MRYQNLPTEQVNPRTEGLDLLSTAELVRSIHEEDRLVLPAVEAALPEVARVVDLAAAALGGGGRLVYVGAGTSGRLGFLDASECPPTFGTDPGRVVALMAGGRDALFRAAEGAEDDAGAGARDLAALHPGPRDVVVGIAASGTTPYVRGALAEGARSGAATVLVTAGRAEGAEADVVVHLDTGPEVVAGSTRMKAGTATKLVLNTISTAAMVRIGKVHGNLMVDLVAGSAKLGDRALRIVTELTGLDSEAAGALLDRADGEAKTAVAMGRLDLGPEEARRRLEAAGGFLRALLEAGS